MAKDQTLNQEEIDKLLSGDGDIDDEGQPEEESGAPPAESFDQLPQDQTKDSGLDFILDIPLEVSVELGRTRMVINDLLQLGQGSVIELSKLAGEPLEILVNNKLVARGEVVVVNEKFGIRVTDIVSPIERVKSLG